MKTYFANPFNNKLVGGFDNLTWLNLLGIR